MGSEPNMTLVLPLCTCKAECCDTDDEIGTCKGLLPKPPKPPLVEVVLIHRSDRV